MNDFQYVRSGYGVPAEYGRRVIIGDKPGIIVADRGHYIGVNFDSDRPGVIRNAHPTSEVKYGEIGTIRKMTSAQKRYQEYLEVAECFDGFGHWLKYKQWQTRETEAID